ncbi:hypothetical protein [Actinomadura kijaniata]|uniref:hypothetical protein n=1 Tax=Actinomadura kijaniata TaxID=46161 RepID=UPI000AAB4492|nr:hypothetical protein [Actinomadura kijaniata]
MRFHVYGMTLALGAALLAPTGPAAEAREPRVRAGSLAGETTSGKATSGRRVVQKAQRSRPAPRRAGPVHRLTVRVLGLDGTAPAGDAASMFTVFDLATGAPTTGGLVDGSGRVELPPGVYRVGSWIYVPQPGRPEAKALMIHPRLELTGDATLVLDARATREVKVALDAPETPDARLALGDVIVPMTTQGQRHGYGLPLEDGVRVSPAAGVPLRLLATWTRDGGYTSPYRYTAYHEFAGRIPDRPELDVRARDLARVRTTVPGQGAAQCHGAFLSPDLPDMSAALAHGVVTGPTPSVRTSYLSPGVTWRSDHGLGGTDCAITESGHGTDRFPAPGDYRRSWFTVPSVPVPWMWEARDLRPGVVRRDDRIEVNLSLFSDGAGDHVGPRSAPWEDGHITGDTTLSRDGEPIGTSPFAGYGSFDVPKEPGRYVLETNATRTAPWSPLGTRSSATWTFTSQPSTEPTAPPLMTVRYKAALNPLGQATAGHPFRLDTTVLTPPGVTPRAVARMTAQVSYDDGQTWQPATVRNNRTITLNHPPRPGHVSLRVTATDTAGDSVTQTTIRAYALR